jgi:hypothetical protein
MNCQLADSRHKLPMMDHSCLANNAVAEYLNALQRFRECSRRTYASQKPFRNVQELLDHKDSNDDDLHQLPKPR